MKMYVGLTDSDWFRTLKALGCEEINFWRPKDTRSLTAITEGDLFLFKLHSPDDYIVGGGVFLKFSLLPTSLAWDAFGCANGASSLEEFRKRIYKYRKTDRLSDPDPQIGCIILSMPFFLDERDWIPVPEGWGKSIVQGKTYDTSDSQGQKLFERIQYVLAMREDAGYLVSEPENRYGKEQIIRPRIRQGAFKVLITDAYHRRCAITGEKTLPVLEAAHIKPYSLDGPHEISNGILLRRDYHTLFDMGYITITKNFNIEVSHRIKEDFGIGKEYYAHHGKSLIILPDMINQIPDTRYLEWHNENRYLG